jgi:hypothetical protein
MLEFGILWAGSNKVSIHRTDIAPLGKVESAVSQNSRDASSIGTPSVWQSGDVYDECFDSV